ncbi:MAG: DUF2116 family Zn-ribbon domain-containing protein [Cyclobacteriaceae bacterium]|nr:DUF2116 family Zn-ribbon domain-containing protein [Cyclobacteriaceae bacterium]
MKCDQEKRDTMSFADSLPRNTWMSADFLRIQYGITDLSQFKCDPEGWGGEVRYMLPFRSSLRACPVCGVTLRSKQRTCSTKCRKALSRRKAKQSAQTPNFA